MNKVILYLTSLINRINQQKDSILNEKKLLEIDENNLKSYIDSIENTDFSILEKYLTDDIKSLKEYILVKKLKDYFLMYQNESQIIECVNYLRLLVQSIQSDLVTKITEINEDIKKYDEVIGKYSNLIEFLNNYNESTFFEREELELLNEIIKNVEIDEEIVDFYINIGKNNVKNLKEKETEKYANVELFEQIERDTSPIQEFIEETDVKQEIKEKLSSFSLEKNKEFLNEYFDQVSRIIGLFDSSLEACSVEEVIDSMSAVEEGIEFFEVLNNDELVIASIISIMNACESLDINGIKEVIEYFDNKYVEYLDFNEKAHSEGIESILQNFENLYKDQIKRISDFISSYETHSVEEIKKGLHEYFKGKVEFESFLIIKTYNEIKAIINSAKENNGKIGRDDWQSIKNKITTLNDYMLRKNNTDENVPIESNNPYENNFCNYIVFLDREDFVSQFEQMITDYHDVSYADLLTKINNLIQNDINSLQTNYSKALNYDRKVSNPYYIKELAHGKIRVDYKIVETKKIDGHNVIMICGLNYGNVDSDEKNKFINRTIRNFENNMLVYNGIVTAFNGAETYEELSSDAKKMIEEGIDFYKDMYDKHKNQTDAIGDGGGRK